MQLVPDISSALYAALADNVQALTVLVELYPSDATPGAAGFDPDDATLRIANIPSSFLGHSYARYVTRVSPISRSITPKFNTVSIDLDNHDRSMAAFVLANPMEGMLLVVRLISRAITITTLADSFVVFTGKCEKTLDATSDTVSISARQYIGSVEEETPWRAFDPEDEEGREADDPLFEGFPFRPQNVSVTYSEKVRRGGFLGLLGFKKTEQRTLNYTSQKDARDDQVVPLVLGRAQAVLIGITSLDVGGAINSIMGASEGPIKAWFDHRVLTPGFSQPLGAYYRLGYPGGTNGQDPYPEPGGSFYAGNSYYSHTAWVGFFVNGTDVSVQEPAPDSVAIIMGMLIDLPDNSGEFNLSDWSDNPAFQTRYVLTHPRIFGLDPAFINDLQCIKTACYCDTPVLDLTNGDVLLLPNSESARYGTAFRRYRSTSLFTPEYFKHYFLSDPQDPLPELTLPPAIFYDPTAGLPTLDPEPLVRRRFSSNIYLKDKMKSADFLFKVLLPTFRGYLSQNARGKIDIKCRRPADNTIIRSPSLAGDAEIAVNSILAWVSSMSGQVIVGNDLITSEVRTVIGTRYSATANDITLAVAGNLTASDATLTGGDDDNPASGTIMVTGLGTLTVTIDGRDVSYETVASDTTATAAAMLCQFLKADVTFQSYLKFTWDKNTPTEISVESKLGFLELDSTLEEAHEIAEEVLRVQMSFSDGLSIPADRLNSNILQGSMSWPLGSRQSSVNRIDGTFVDAAHDFQPQPLRTSDRAHIAQTGKVLPESITLTGVDNYSQAKRLENSALAVLRDLDFFMQHTADRRALLLEEGDLICCSHSSGGFRNIALSIEDVELDLSSMTIRLPARRYSSSAYSDEAPARKVPRPTTLSWVNAAPGQPTNLTLSQTNTTQGTSTISGTFDFAASLGSQRARVYYRVQGSTDWIDSGVIVVPDANNKGYFVIPGLPAGTYEVKVVPENSNGLGTESAVETISTTVSNSPILAAGNVLVLDFIKNFYRKALDREPTSEELGDEFDLLDGNIGSEWYHNATQLGHRLFVGAEYLARARTDTQFISDLYLAYLSRSADAEGLAFWLSELGSQTREQITTAFGVSVEFRLRAFTAYGWRPENHWEPVTEPTEELVFEGDEIVMEEVAN